MKPCSIYHRLIWIAVFFFSIGFSIKVIGQERTITQSRSYARVLADSGFTAKNPVLLYHAAKEILRFQVGVLQTPQTAFKDTLMLPTFLLKYAEHFLGKKTEKDTLKQHIIALKKNAEIYERRMFIGKTRSGKSFKIDIWEDRFILKSKSSAFVATLPGLKGEKRIEMEVLGKSKQCPITKGENISTSLKIRNSNRIIASATNNTPMLKIIPLIHFSGIQYHALMQNHDRSVDTCIEVNLSILEVE